MVISLRTNFPQAKMNGYQIGFLQPVLQQYDLYGKPYCFHVESYSVLMWSCAAKCTSVIVLVK